MTSGMSLLLPGDIVIDKFYIDPNETVGLPTVLVIVALVACVRLMMLGAIGEYVGACS